MDLGTEFSMALSPSSYKRLVSGEDCQVVARQAIRQLLENVMEEALRVRIRHRRLTHGPGSDRRNGYYERGMLSSWGWIQGIRVPRGRVSTVAEVILPKYQRRQPEFDAAVAHSFLLGHSTRNCSRFFAQIFGDAGISHTQVSQILAKVDESCKAWRNRALRKPYAFLWLDGKCAAIAGALKRPHTVLWAYAATEEDQQRELIGFEVHRSEAIPHWESLLGALVRRGLDPQKLKLVIRDENSCCAQAILSLLGAVPQQSCAVHLERNLGKLVHRDNRGQFQNAVSEIFKQPSLRQARTSLAQVLQHWQEREPGACLYLRANVDKSLHFYQVATNGIWRSHLKSTNMLERFFRELKRFEKSRQFRFADQKSCERFYYLFAWDYNHRHPKMPRPRNPSRRQVQRLEALRPQPSRPSQGGTTVCSTHRLLTGNASILPLTQES